MNYIELFKRYLLVDRKYSSETIKSYLNGLNKYLDFCKNNNINILNINKNQLIKYLDYLKKKNISTKSMNHNISVIKTFYKLLKIENIISDCINIDISYGKTIKTLPKYLTLEEVNNLLDINMTNHYSYRDKAMIETMYATGIRVSELMNLKLSDYDKESDTIKVFSKGSKERIIPIGAICKKYLELYINNYRNKFIKHNVEYLFLNNKGTKLSRQSFYIIIKKIALIKGIKKDISPHILRHSFATHLLNKGADIVSIKELLGHSSIQTTEIYTHISKNKLKDEYMKYHPGS